MPFMLDGRCTIDPLATDSACSIGWLEVSLLSRRYLFHKMAGGVGVPLLSLYSLTSRRSGGCILRMLRPRASSCLRACFLGVLAHVHACLVCFCWSRSVCLSFLVSLSLYFMFVLCVLFFILPFSGFILLSLLSCYLLYLSYFHVTDS